MTKTYINDAIIGNSSMLGCVTSSGELVRLFWPHIDHPQHLEKMVCGIFNTQQKYSTSWIHEESFCHKQSYVKHTNILITSFECNEKELSIEQIDYCIPEKDMLIRRYEIKNNADHEVDLGFILYSSFVTSTPELRSILFDDALDSLISYRYNYYIGITGDREVYQFQLGNNGHECARSTELHGCDSVGMMPDGAMSYLLGTFSPGEKKSFNLSICASHTIKGVKLLIREFRKLNLEKITHETEEYWKNYINNARHVKTGINDVDNLYQRTLLVFALMSDKKSGGLLASAEIDEGFTRCGRYAYCWGRDAAFITDALDQCGLHDEADRFYNWAIEAQDDEGYWHQRYHMDGNLAPSWGLQIDETGTLLWGMMKHYERTKDRVFLEKIWDSLERGIEFMVRFIDPETDLPKPSFDLWEERCGEHAYSSAAVYGGIMAGVQAGRILGKSQTLITHWERKAVQIQTAMVKYFWRDDWKRFIRSIRVKLNPWGCEYSGNTMIITVNNKGYKRDVSLEDGNIDVSMLGVSIPFGAFDPLDEKVAQTVKEIERVLTSPGSGGIKRYENDNYIGGNPWILTTL